MGKIFAALFIIGGFYLGAYLSETSLGEDAGYTIGFIIALAAYLLFMPWFRKTTKTDRESREMAMLEKICKERREQRASQKPVPTYEESESKECPYCAEIIKFKAIICRYCGRELPRKDNKELTG